MERKRGSDRGGRMTDGLDAKAKQAATAVATHLKSTAGAQALKQSSELAKELDGKLRNEERIDPKTLHERITY
jgi:hypothetical protein